MTIHECGFVVGAVFLLIGVVALLWEVRRVHLKENDDDTRS